MKYNEVKYGVSETFTFIRNDYSRIWLITNNEPLLLSYVDLMRFYEVTDTYQRIIVNSVMSKRIEQIESFDDDTIIEIHNGLVKDPSKYDRSELFMRATNLRQRRTWINSITAKESLDIQLISQYFEFDCFVEIYWNNIKNVEFKEKK